MAVFGVPVVVYASPDDATGRQCMGIVSYGDATPQQDPRGLRAPRTVALYNSPVDGLSVDERTEHHEVAVPRAAGSGQRIRVGIARPMPGNNPAMTTWELI